MPTSTAFYAQKAVTAQDLNSDNSGNATQLPNGTNSATGASGVIIVPDTPPALNVMAPTARPPIPPPPETPSSSRSLVVQPSLKASMPQAWRSKALLLFKPNNNLDKNSVFATRLSLSYAKSFNNITKKIAGSGITLEAVSFSSGHILLSCQNDRGLLDKAIIAMKQASQNDDSGSGTDVKIFCDTRNKSLTMIQLRSILDQVDGSYPINKDRSGAESL